jgi:integrase
LRVTRAPATVNRYLSVLRQIFKHALEMRDPITRQPVLETLPAIKDLRELNRRARPIPEPVLERLLEILPQHTKDAIILTLYFGFRRGEVFGLQEKNVDWLAEGIRLYAEDVKDKEDAFLPGSQEAMGHLRCVAMEAEARHVHHLITFRRSDAESWRPLQMARSGWDRAMDIIERERGCRWRWHDLRAAYITHVALTSGAVTAQVLARHSNFETTRAYIDVSDESRRIAAERTAARPALRAARGSLTKLPHSFCEGPAAPEL